MLTYHRIAEPNERPHLDPSLISATPSNFALQMRHLAEQYDVVTVQEVIEAVAGRRTLSPRAVLITFDDGYRDFIDHAWPVLNRFTLPAVLFIPTAYPGDPERPFWWDRLYHAMTFTSHAAVRDALLGTRPGDPEAVKLARLREVREHLKALPHEKAMAALDEICRRLEVVPPRESRVLTWPEIRWLSTRGITIAAHTRTHPILTQMTREQVREEVHGAQEDLRRQIQSVLPVFCYPSGGHDDSVVSVLSEEGFKVAFTTLDGHNDLSVEDPLRLRRTNISCRTTPPLFRIRLWRWFSHVDALRHRQRTPISSKNSHAGGSSMLATLETKQESTQIHIVPQPPQPPQARPPKVAYIMSRFPKLTETFVLNEILEMKAKGVPVEIYPLRRERQAVTHRKAEKLTREAHFHPFFSLPILCAQLYFILQKPRTYFRALAEALSGTLRSPRYFAGAVAYFPKSVRFAYEFSRNGIQHVHAHFANHPALAALVIHRLTGIPFSFTAHGSDVQVDQTMLGRKVQAARNVVAVSNYNKELMVRVAGEQTRNKIHVVHCGINPELFAPNPDHTPGTVQIICIASFEPVKGHRYLVEACRLLKSRGVIFQCHFVGDGPQRENLQQQIARAGLEKEIVLHGALRHVEVARLVAQADVLALPSVPTQDGRREGIPVAIMEGMASGLPVVSTRIGGIPELVEPGRTGFLVAPRLSYDLADALQQLAEDPELRRRMGAAGREKVLREFNLRRSAETLLGLFEAGHAAPAPGERGAASEVPTRMNAAVLH